MRAVRYRPDGSGDAWRAAVTGSALAVLPPAVTPHAAEAVWRRLESGGIGAVLESLTGAFGTSLAAIPPFGLAVAEGDGVRVAVRGPVTLVVETSSGTEAVSGAGIATWTERFLPGVVRVSVDLGVGTDADMLPIESGVVPVAEIVLDLAVRETVAGAAAADAAAAPPADTAVAPGPPIAEEPAAAEVSPIAEELQAPEEPPVAEEPPAEGPLEEPVEELAAREPVVPEPAAEDVGETIASERTPAEESDPEPAPEPASIPGLVTGVPPVHTLGGSPVSSPRIPGPHDHAPAGEAPGGAETIAGIEDDPVLGATIASPRAPSPGTGPVPSLPPFVPPVPPLPTDLGDHDGATVSVAEARAMRAGASSSFEAIEDVPPRSPSRGRILLSDGRAVELERTVIVGRRPRSTRPAENDLPTLVAVDGPQHDISRNHVEIRAEGEHVLAVDLASTNGTVLLRGGHDPVRLHPNEPTMVVDADVLDLGDGVTLTFEELP
jgi:hypothetical protein